MQVTKTIHVEAHDEPKIIYVCDTCQKEYDDRYWGKIKECHICEADVCQGCAIITDHWCLEPGDFAGEHPDYFCPKCWKAGEDIREQIQEARRHEIQLWKQWRDICKVKQTD